MIVLTNFSSSGEKRLINDTVIGKNGAEYKYPKGHFDPVDPLEELCDAIATAHNVYNEEK